MVASKPPRRRFVMLGHTQVIDTAFALNDIAGGAGRLDVLCRAVTSALCLSHGVRSDTEVWTVIDHGATDAPRTLVWHGDRLRNLNPDERSTAALFKKAFAHDAIEHLEEVHPGLEVAELGLRQVLDRVQEAGPMVLLDRDGADLRKQDKTVAPGGTFLLSDHCPWTDDETSLLSGLGVQKVSVGPHWLHGHQVITLVHDELDRRGSRSS